jgi:hypothetical protein
VGSKSTRFGFDISQQNTVNKDGISTRFGFDISQQNTFDPTRKMIDH